MHRTVSQLMLLHALSQLWEFPEVIVCVCQITMLGKRPSMIFSLRLFLDIK